MPWSAGGAKRLSAPLELVERCLALQPVERQDSGLLHAYGDLLDRLKRPREAFAAHRQANRNRQQSHDPVAHRDLVDRLIAVFSRETLQSLFGAQNRRSPIFVVGMPRSGTSLVEQILASHSEVYGAGEQEGMLSLAARLPFVLREPQAYPDCIHALSPDKLRLLGQSYFDSLPRRPWRRHGLSTRCPSISSTLG